MIINENLKMRTKPLEKNSTTWGNRPTLNTKHFLLISNVQIRPPKGKTIMFPHHFGYVKLHGFHGNPFCEFIEWGWECFYKNTPISAATPHRILNLVSKGMALLLAGRICKLSNFNIYEFQ